jgi:hypothetical protein
MNSNDSNNYTSNYFQLHLTRFVRIDILYIIKNKSFSIFNHYLSLEFTFLNSECSTTSTSGDISILFIKASS